MEVIPGIHQIKVPIPDNPLGFLNCYLVQGKNGWLMIDTGWYTQDAFSALEAGLKDMGLGFTDWDADNRGIVYLNGGTETAGGNTGIALVSTSA